MWSTGEDQRRGAFDRLDQRLGDGARTSKVAEAERIVAVKQDTRGAADPLVTVTHGKVPICNDCARIKMAPLTALQLDAMGAFVNSGGCSLAEGLSRNCGSA
jgi:hypothetical protein